MLVPRAAAGMVGGPTGVADSRVLGDGDCGGVVVVVLDVEVSASGAGAGLLVQAATVSRPAATASRAAARTLRRRRIAISTTQTPPLGFQGGPAKPTFGNLPMSSWSGYPPNA